MSPPNFNSFNPKLNQSNCLPWHVVEKKIQEEIEKGKLLHWNLYYLGNLSALKINIEEISSLTNTDVKN